MTTEVGIGVIGLGWMGQVHTRAYRRLRDHYGDLDIGPRLVAAADPVPGRAEDAVARLGFESATTDWHAVINRPDVDAVSVATPNALHAEIGQAVAARGLLDPQVLARCRDVGEVTALAAAIRAAGVRSTVGFNYRHAPAVAHARDLVASGALGVVRHFRGSFLADYSADPDGGLSWRFRRSEAGHGVLGDLMTHLVDLVTHVIGPIARVRGHTATFIADRPLVQAGASHFTTGSASTERGAVENEDWATALVETASGAVGTLEASRASVGPHARYTLELHGSCGALAWDFERMNEIARFQPAGEIRDPGYTRVLLQPGDGDFGRFQPARGIGMGFDDLKVVEAAGFLRSIADSTDAPPTVDDALRAMTTIEAIARSARSGTWEELRVVELG